MASPPAGPEVQGGVSTMITAQLALTHEGDYFTLLGVARTATGQDIRRAYVELRRLFEPARLLTAASATLVEEVALIREVLDEAYDVLRVHERREAYRRALEVGEEKTALVDDVALAE